MTDQGCADKHIPGHFVGVHEEVIKPGDVNSLGGEGEPVLQEGHLLLLPLLAGEGWAPPQQEAGCDPGEVDEEELSRVSHYGEGDGLSAPEILPDRLSCDTTDLQCLLTTDLRAEDENTGHKTGQAGRHKFGPHCLGSLRAGGLLTTCAVG